MKPAGNSIAGEVALPSGRPFRLASDLALAPMDSTTVFPPAQAGGVVRWNGGGSVFLVGSRFTLAGQHADMLLGMLPPIVHIRKKQEQAALRWSIERMMQELHAEQAGNYLMAQHLAHMMLLQALRVHMTRGMEGSVGWLFALADKLTVMVDGAVIASDAPAAIRMDRRVQAAYLGEEHA